MPTQAQLQGLDNLPAKVAEEAAEARQNIHDEPEKVPGALGVLPSDAPLPEGIKRYADDPDPGKPEPKATAKKATAKKAPAKKK